MSERTDAVGTKASCAMCGASITFVGPYWDHDGEIKPRHPATPKPWKMADTNVYHFTETQREEITAIIRNEIQWCKDNPLLEKVTPEFRDGFIKGLEQALYLISRVGLHGSA